MALQVLAEEILYERTYIYFFVGMKRSVEYMKSRWEFRDQGRW